jgi:hypothetical protein
MAVCLCRVLNFNTFITGKGRGNSMRNYLAAVLLHHGWGGELPLGMPSPTIMPPCHYQAEISFGCNIFEGFIRRIGGCGSFWKVRDNL